MPKNAYPLLPEVPYKKTMLTNATVQAYIAATAYDPLVKAAVFTIFRIESGNGKSGVNGNYNGVQADGARLGGAWDAKVVATVVKTENETKKLRRFIVWDKWQTGIDFVLSKAAKRGIFIGGTAMPYSKLKINTVEDLARAYKKEWVEGDPKPEPSKDDADMFKDIYTQVAPLFKSKKVV